VAYKANDGIADSAPATFSITVTPAVRPTCAAGQQDTTRHGVAKALTLACTDPQVDPITYAVVEAPDAGKGALGTVAGDKVTFTPASGFVGDATFTFKGSDGTHDSLPATFTVHVTNAAPSCTSPGDKAATAGVALSVPVTCTDVDGDALTVSKAGEPAHGTLSVSAGTLTYTPASDYAGPDQISFKAGDGIAESPAVAFTVTVTKPAATGPGPGAGTGTGSGAADAALIATGLTRLKTAKVTTNGKVAKLSIPANAFPPNTVVAFALAAARSALASALVSVGKVTVTVKPDSATTVKIKLSAKARKALKKRRKLKLTLTIAAKAPTGPSATIKRKLTLRKK
jgi:hypothetical protein